MAALGGAGIASLTYGRYVEPQWPEITTSHVPVLPAKSKNLRLLHMSDFHASPLVSMDYIEREAARALALQPDVICLTGDYVSATIEEAGRLAGVFQALARQAPTYAVLGNHDGGLWAIGHGGYAAPRIMVGFLSDNGVHVLQNRAATVQLKGAILRLVGVGDLWAGDCDVDSAFAHPSALPPDTTLFLAHNPDTKDLAQAYSWDLMLSGHTHGGQVILPLIGPPFVPVNDRRYISGLHQWQDRQLYVTRGIGSILGLRFNCRPEISLLELSARPC